MWTLCAVRSPHLWHNVVTHAPYTTLAPPGVTHFRDDEKCIRKPKERESDSSQQEISWESLTHTGTPFPHVSDSWEFLLHRDRETEKVSL